MDERKIIQIDYTNWCGERRVREILPTGHLEFYNTEYHHDTQWLLEAADVEDGKIKLFAMKDIHSFGVTEPASPWRDIESAPKDGTKILAFARGHTDYYGVAEWAEADSNLNRPIGVWIWDFLIRPTHWVPLSEPPR